MPVRKGDNERIVQSSGNIFADLGLDLSPEEEIKIEIAREITRVIVARRYTQSQVARLLGTTQARVSEITCGKLTGYSAERLLRYLLSLGVNIDVYVSDASDAAPSGGRVQFHIPVPPAAKNRRA
ncbi:helix-turn-helix domain-containing protein [Rhizobium sp. YTU87027]|uniref:helix-turn-helix domain-containing protein n=1 Tax=Rhizobium sp. YTU87027 TaxID=3417741 RepID=UPI003D68DAB7